MVTYFNDNESSLRNTGNIRIYNEDAFVGMREAGQLVAQCLDEIVDIVRPGVTTEEIDRHVYQFCLTHNVLPAPLNYRGYTKCCCTSVNHVVCHGIPGPKRLKDGDIVNIDVTIIKNGWHGDASRMYIAGQAKRAAARLIDVTYEALLIGIAAAKPAARLGDVGAAIQSHVEKNRFSVVRDFCGHGIGRLFHDAPNVLHYGVKGSGIELRPGMIFTIEPMVNSGRYEVKLLSDGWTAVTRDRGFSAQFEHSIAITEDGAEIFTLSPLGLDNPNAKTANDIQP